MILTQLEKIILAGIHTDGAYLRESDPRSTEGAARRADHFAHAASIEAAKAGFVPIDLGGWLGDDPTGAEARAASRAYVALEGRGLLERHNLTSGGTRTTHLRLTPAGEAIAQKLVDGDK